MNIKTALATLFLLIASFFIVCKVCAQTSIGCSEYTTLYSTLAGEAYVTKWIGSTPTVTNTGLTGIGRVGSGQYNTTAIDTVNHKVYWIDINGVPKLYDTTNDGRPFRPDNPGQQILGLYQSVALPWHDSIWYWNNGNLEFAADPVNQQGGASNNPPTKLVQPVGKRVVSIAFSSPTPSGGNPAFTTGVYLWALCDDGTIFEYTRASTTPTQVSFTGTAIKIALLQNCKVIETTTDLLVTGGFGSYAGGTNGSSSFASVKSAWQAAGCTFPLKQMIGNFQTLHVIDANDNMYASGANPNGEVGNGREYNPYRTRPQQPWFWNFANNELVTAPVQIRGKWKNICTSTTVTFYLYAQDLLGNWYSWGRNKSLVLGNGRTLSINDYAAWPNALDVPAPRLVTPLSQTWTVQSFSPNASQPPVANAGCGRSIITDTTTLYGDYSSQQEFTITGWNWVQRSGPAAVISSPTSANTRLTGLTNGTYVFRLTVTNSNGQTDFNDVTLVVTGQGGTQINGPFKVVQAVPVNKHTYRTDWSTTGYAQGGNTRYFILQKRRPPVEVWTSITGRFAQSVTDSVFAAIDYQRDWTVDNQYSVLQEQMVAGVNVQTRSAVVTVKKN